MELQYMIDLLGCEFLVRIEIEAHTNHAGLDLSTSLSTLKVVSANNDNIDDMPNFAGILKGKIIEQHEDEIADVLREQIRNDGKDDREYDRLIDREAFDGLSEHLEHYGIEL